MSDLIDRDEALTALRDTLKNGGKSKGLRPVTFEMIWAIKSLPSAEPDDWLEKNKDLILQAGMEGREVEFRIGGRLFAIREKAQ